MEKSKLNYSALIGNNFISLLLILFLTTCFATVNTISQSNGLHSVNPLDEYAVLRDMTVQSSSNSPESNLLEYRLNADQAFDIRYFIGPNSFTVKSDIDILNRSINAKLEIGNSKKTYYYERTRIDSFYIQAPGIITPLRKFYYYPKDDVYGEVMDQGKYTLIECYYLDIRKGNRNPVLSSGPEEDKLTLKKASYLVDTGLWYSIPKKKGLLEVFIKKHYGKSIEKKNLKKSHSIDILKELN